MSQSLSQLVVHIIFSTKNRQPFLRPKTVQEEIYAYLAGILRNLGCDPIKIGGSADDVHILSSMSRTITLADLIGVSSRRRVAQIRVEMRSVGSYISDSL